MKVKNESEVAQSCLTLSDPVDCSLPGSPVCGISQARVLERFAIAFSKILHMTLKFVGISPLQTFSDVPNSHNQLLTKCIYLEVSKAF